MEESTEMIFVDMKVESGLAIARISTSVGSGWTSFFAFLFVVDVTSALASPILSSLPSKVTREFSDAQLKFPLLNLARIVFSNKGIEKLV